MNTLLIFFAIPLAVIVISIALQKILESPFIVSAIILVIFLIVAAITGDLTWLIAAIIYAIIAFITAVLTCLIHKLCNRNSETGGISENNCGICCMNNNDNNNSDVLGITQDDIRDLTNALNNFTNCCCRRRR